MFFFKFPSTVLNQVMKSKIANRTKPALIWTIFTSIERTPFFTERDVTDFPMRRRSEPLTAFSRKPLSFGLIFRKHPIRLPHKGQDCSGPAPEGSFPTTQPLYLNVSECGGGKVAKLEGLEKPDGQIEVRTEWCDK